MEKITVQFPFVHVINPTTGRNLGLGFAYFGTIDGDPYNNPADRIPIYVRQPDGAAVLISQPVVLNAAGIFTYNGVPAQILVDTQYSLDVRTSTNVQAYYSPRVTTIDSALAELLERQQIKSLYDYPESNFEGDCSAAMDLALADDNVLVVIVPDNVTLKRHVFDSPHKTIVGGNNVTFVDNGCGLYPRVCEYVCITQFRNAQLPVFPISGGTAANGGIFVGTATGHNIGTIIISDNTTYGGRIGVAVGPEGGSGQIRNLVQITGNTFEQNNGISGGTGYGIQYANELLTGMAYIANNTVIKSCRNGIYIARNAGQAPVYVYNNHVIDHRYSADNKGAGAYPAFNVSRASNVHGIGNQATRPYDGSLLIGPEEEAPALLNAKNISWRDFTIDSPGNNSPQIFIQYIEVPTGPRTDHLIFDGISYTCVGNNAPLVDYNFGQRIVFSNVFIRYVGVLSGGLSPFFLKGGDTANSGGLKFSRIRVAAQDCVGADFSVFTLAGAMVTQNLGLHIEDVSYSVDSTLNKVWNPSAAVSNTRIIAYDTEELGMVFASGVYFRQGPNPSIRTISRDFNLGTPSPNGVITPKYIGEIIVLTDTDSSWQATDTTNTSWILLGRVGSGSNKYGPSGVSHVIAMGYAHSATEARFPLYGDMATAPISISVTSTFEVVPANGVAISGNTGKTPTLSVASSNKVTWVAVTGMSGLTVGAVYLLRTETGTSAIQVNY